MSATDSLAQVRRTRLVVHDAIERAGIGY